MINSDIALPSNRKFGYTFTFIFAVLCMYMFIKKIAYLDFIFFTLSILSLIVTIIKPSLLLPFNKIWMKFGLMIGKIVNPVVMGLIFFIIFTPIGILMKLFGRDELQLKINTNKSNWKLCDKEIKNETDFEKQF